MRFSAINELHQFDKIFGDCGWHIIAKVTPSKRNGHETSLIRNDTINVTSPNEKNKNSLGAALQL